MHSCSIVQMIGVIVMTIVCLFQLNIKYVSTESYKYSSRSKNPNEFTTASAPSCPERCICRPFNKNVSDSLMVRCTQASLTKIPNDIPEITVGLDLSENQLTELPAYSFAGLSRLRMLTLRHNNISRMSANTFVGLVALKDLVLNENRGISAGFVDYLFSPLSNLSQMHLVRCGLTHFNIKTFLNLTNLAFLDLIGNMFVVFPDFAYNDSPVFPRLKSITLDDNNIKLLSYENASRQLNLSEISVTGNYIEKICSGNAGFVSVKKLVRRNDTNSRVVMNNLDDDFMGRELQLNWTRNIFYQAPISLNIFILSKNKIKMLTANCFANLPFLERLILAENRITSIDALAFNRLENLKHLTLTGNPIVAYEDHVFSPASSLDFCDLSRGAITSFNVNAFANQNKLYILVLDSNNLKRIPEFVNDSSPALQHLGRLSLASNKIVSFHDSKQSVILNEVTLVSRNLTSLCLDKNNIEDFIAGDHSERFPNLRILSVKFNKIRTIYPSKSSEIVKLQSLDLSNNPIKEIHDGAFSTFHFLRFLDLTHCQISQLNIKALVNLSNLRQLHLDGNSFTRIPNFIDSKNISVLPNLTYFSMSKNKYRLETLVGLIGLPKLYALVLNENSVRISIDILENLTNLKSMHLVKCNVSIVKSGLKSNSLTDLVLNNSFIIVNQYSVFEESPMLKTIQMANCTQDARAPKYQTFRNMIHLEHVDLSSTGIIPHSGTFVNSTNIKYLNLNKNVLGQLDRNIFKQMTKLESLMLRETGLNSVNYTSLPERLWTQLLEIDLSNNSYVCDCGIAWFRRWLKSTNVTILNSKKYICDFPPISKHIPIQSLSEPSDLECFMPPFDWIIVSIFIFVFVVLFISMLVSLLHRFRWHVRYWQSIVTARRKQYEELVDQRPYAYDAFVMYCQQDSKWVINELRPRLETTEKLRLCIHHRDWLGGRDIVDNITESIENSRKCLLIVSNAFAASQMCHFELTMAQSRLFQEDRDNLVLVVLEEISECYMTPRLRLQMQRQTYIEWTDNILGQQLFWARLQGALKRPNQSITHSPIPQSVFSEVRNDED